MSMLHSTGNFELVSSEWHYTHRHTVCQGTLSDTHSSVADHSRCSVDNRLMRSESLHPGVLTDLESGRILSCAGANQEHIFVATG